MLNYPTLNFQNFLKFFFSIYQSVSLKDHYLLFLRILFFKPRQIRQPEFFLDAARAADKYRAFFRFEFLYFLLQVITRFVDRRK